MSYWYCCTNIQLHFTFQMVLHFQTQLFDPSFSVLYFQSTVVRRVERAVCCYCMLPMDDNAGRPCRDCRVSVAFQTYTNCIFRPGTFRRQHACGVLWYCHAAAGSPFHRRPGRLDAVYLALHAALPPARYPALQQIECFVPRFVQRSMPRSASLDGSEGIC